MRVAFDLDGTLIPAPGSAMSVEPLGRLARALSSEPIRAGTPQLLRKLSQCGHEIWLYTTSFRSPIRLRLWFASFSVQLDGVINQARHQTVVAGGPIRCSKYPPAFGINLLVDDSAGVEIEGQRLGFSVLRIEPNDTAWSTRVALAVTKARAARFGIPRV
jgi:hypothetical protein